MYKIGDYVIYNQLCVCEIKGEEVMLLEPFGKKNYYKLTPVFEKQNTCYYVPADYVANLRPITSKEEAVLILKNFEKERVSVNNVKRSTLLTAYYKERFDNAGLKECLILLKEIHIKNQKINKKLNETDVKYYSRAERIVVEELSIIFNESVEVIKERINELLQK